MAQFWHIVMVFIMLGVFFNIMARPGSFNSLLSGTFSSLTGLTKNIAAIQ